MLDYRALRRKLADFEPPRHFAPLGLEPPPPVRPAMEQAQGDV